MTGLPYLIRVIGFGMRAPKQPNPGRSLAGIVAAGRASTAFVPGDEVYGTCGGSFTRICHRATRSACTDPNQPLFRAGGGGARLGHCRPASRAGQGRGRTDRQCWSSGRGAASVWARGRITKAFGSSRHRCVQLGTQADLVRSLGAEQIINYTREDFADGRNRYDVIVDIAGNGALSRLRRALIPPESRHRRRRDKRTLARWIRPSTADTGAVTSGEPETHSAYIEGKHKSRHPSQAGRGQRTHERHRPDVPLNESPGAVRHFIDDPQARQGRHRHVTPEPARLFAVRWAEPSRRHSFRSRPLSPAVDPMAARAAQRSGSACFGASSSGMGEPTFIWAP